MLEKHAMPGGCTTNFERKGFRFEASTHVINGCEPGGMIYQQLAKIDAQDRIEFIKLGSFGRIVDEARGTEFDLPWELGEHVEMLVGQFPHEETGSGATTKGTDEWPKPSSRISRGGTGRPRAARETRQRRGRTTRP